MSEFDRWEGRFSRPDYVFGTAPNAFLRRYSGLMERGQSVLCLADGEGRNGVWLAQQGLDVLSQDFSPRAQDKARALARDRDVQLRFELSDIHTRAWPEAEFDAVAGIFFQFAGPEQRARIFDGIKRTLKPGGLVLIEGYGPKQLDYRTGGPGKLENLYTEDLLRAAFSDFSEVSVTAYDAEIDEGSGHSGMSALVDLVARK